MHDTLSADLACAAAAALLTLAAFVEARVRVRRVGGLTFVRFGRFGASFYRARRPQPSQREA